MSSIMFCIFEELKHFFYKYTIFMFCYDSGAGVGKNFYLQTKSHRKTANVLFLNAFEIIAHAVDNR